MLEKCVLSSICQLSCLLLGLSANLGYAFFNVDAFMLLRYLGLSEYEAQIIWYFLRRINLFIGVIAIVGILLYRKVTRIQLCKWNWILFTLYATLCAYLRYHVGIGPRFTTEIQWMLVGISFASNVVQCQSLFYVLDSKAPGGRRERPLRLMFYLLGACISGCIARIVVNFNRDSEISMITGSNVNPSVIQNIVSICSLITFVTSLTVTWLLDNLWFGADRRYFSLSIPSAAKFLTHYDGWPWLILTAFGWAISPFCGILTGFMSLRASHDRTSEMATTQHGIFLVILVFVILVVKNHLLAEAQGEDCVNEVLKGEVMEVLRARSEPVTINDNEDVSAAKAGYANANLFRRLFRDSQPWNLLPPGYWDQWSESDYETNKWLTEFLLLYFKLIQAKCGTKYDAGTLDCIEQVCISQSERYQLLLEIKDSFPWAIHDFICHYEGVLTVVDNQVTQDVVVKCGCCIFTNLQCRWLQQTCCKVKMTKYECKNCIYGESGRLRASKQYMKGTLSSCVKDARSLSEDMQFCKLLCLSPANITSTLLQEAIDEVDWILTEYLNLLLLCAMADEWLMLCTAMKIIYRHLDVYFHNHNKQGKHVDESAKSCPSITQQNIPQNDDNQCRGCGLFCKLLGCICLLHEKQCAMLAMLDSCGMDELKHKLPTLCHTRAVVLLVTNYGDITYTDDRHSLDPQMANPKWHCYSYNATLDSLLDSILGDLDDLICGEQILAAAISLVACNTTNILVEPSLNPQRIGMLAPLVSSIFHRSIMAGMGILDWVMGIDSKKEFGKYHCVCDHKNTECCTGSCKNKNCGEGAIKCILCEDNPSFSEIQNIFDNCPTKTPECHISSACCSEKSCTDSNSASICGQIAGGKSDKCGHRVAGCGEIISICINDEQSPKDLLNPLSGLLHSSFSNLCDFVRGVYCAKANGENCSVIGNICNFHNWLTVITNYATDDKTGCIPDNKNSKCVNKTMCELVRCVFQKNTGTSQACPDDCKRMTCICCLLNTTDDHNETQTCTYAKSITSMSLGGIMCLVSSRCSSIKEHISCVTCNMDCVKVSVGHIKSYISDIEDIHKRAICGMMSLVKCAIMSVKLLVGCLRKIITTHDNNLDMFKSRCHRIKEKCFTLGERRANYASSLRQQRRTLSDTSSLMDNIDLLFYDLYKRTTRATMHVDTARKNARTTSMKSLICELLLEVSSKKCGSITERLFCFSFWFNGSMVLFLFMLCIAMSILPGLGAMRAMVFHNTVGMAGSIVGPILILVGLTSLSKVPHQGVYLINIALVLGILTAITISWFCQSYAYKSYISDQFVMFYKNYRTIYPDYIDKALKKTYLWAEGLRRLVKADFTAFWDMFAAGTMTFNKDIYNVSLPKTFVLNDTVKTGIQRLWSVDRVRQTIRSDVLESMKMNIGLFFDLVSFTLLDLRYWNFITDLDPRKRVVYPLDLVWESWIRGRVLTSGHYHLYLARMEALDIVTNEIVNNMDAAALNRTTHEKLLLTFQKQNLNEIAKKCLSLPFVPHPPLLPHQRQTLISLFVEQYQQLWSDVYVTEDSLDTDETKGKETKKDDVVPTETKGYTIPELKRYNRNWELGTLAMCRDVYSNINRCLDLVILTSKQFEDFVASCPHGTVFKSEEQFLEAYEDYCERSGYELRNDYYDEPVTTPMLNANMESDIYQVPKLNIKSPTDNATETVDDLVKKEQCTSLANGFG
ncbi:hypothetical protein BaOVIS_021610 [Babesia ovis]|uniref:Uncharacterized protein n=1 Tax=Babesia ovis TaxID=5869 RepID=A0A9W5TAZ0_BABOV|nr:hypothetical protein BaOVIS_021610 [Babesia ovis]